MKNSHNEKHNDFSDLEEIEDNTGKKHELIDGFLIMMSVGALIHSRISARLTSILDRLMSLKQCAVFNSDAKLKVNDNFYYPDASVQCSKIKDDAKYLENPSLLAEVLSPSTASMDRVKKLNDYLSIDGLKAYLIIRQDVREIELYYKENEEIKTILFKSNETVEIKDWIQFKVDELYDNILGNNL